MHQKLHAGTEFLMLTGADASHVLSDTCMWNRNQVLTVGFLLYVEGTMSATNSLWHASGATQYL